jgi:hypothetical protein
LVWARALVVALKRENAAGTERDEDRRRSEGRRAMPAHKLAESVDAAGRTGMQGLVREEASDIRSEGSGGFVATIRGLG